MCENNRKKPTTDCYFLPFGYVGYVTSVVLFNVCNFFKFDISVGVVQYLIKMLISPINLFSVWCNPTLTKIWPYPTCLQYWLSYLSDIWKETHLPTHFGLQQRSIFKNVLVSCKIAISRRLSCCTAEQYSRNVSCHNKLNSYIFIL